MIKAGQFEISLNGPYPVWVDLKYGGQTINTIHHKELSDLKYAVDKAMQEARLLLRQYMNEV